MAAPSVRVSLTNNTTADATEVMSNFNGLVSDLTDSSKDLSVSAVNMAGNLAIATNKFTVAASDGDTAIAGTLGVTGAATLSSTLGVTGATTITGALSAGGDFKINTNKFVVDSSTGDTTIDGALTVSGNSIFSGTVSSNGSFDVNTTAMTVDADNGNTTIGGTLDVTGNVAINTDKMTVDASTGNTVIAGTLGVTGTTTLGTANITTANITTANITTANVTNLIASGDIYTTALVDWTGNPNVTGWSVVTEKRACYKKVGKTVTYWYMIIGTGNNQTVNISVPINMGTAMVAANVIGTLSAVNKNSTITANITYFTGNDYLIVDGAAYNGPLTVSGVIIYEAA